MKKIIILLFFLGIIVNVAWSPWVNKSFVKNQINKNQKNEGVLKSCLLELIDSSKAPFGAIATVKYRCPKKNGEEGASFQVQKARLFVSPFGTVHYLRPSIL